MLDMTKEEEIAMAKSENEFHKEEKRRYRKDQIILESVKKQVSLDFFKLIEQEIEQSEGGYDYQIVDKHYGDYQDEEDIKEETEE